MRTDVIAMVGLPGNGRDQRLEAVEPVIDYFNIHPFEFYISQYKFNPHWCNVRVTINTIFKDAEQSQHIIEKIYNLQMGGFHSTQEAFIGILKFLSWYTNY